MDISRLVADVDFSKAFKKSMQNSSNKKYQDAELMKKNRSIIQKNIETLEKCISKNMEPDNTVPYDKTFVCSGFSELLIDNNGTKLEDEVKNLSQFFVPMEKIGVLPAVITGGIKSEYIDTRYSYLLYKIQSDAITKNSFGWLEKNSSMIVRMSNTEHTFPKYTIAFSNR